MALPELRGANAADIPAMLEVFFHAMEDLDEKRRRPLQARNAAPLEMHFDHLLATDPGSAVVAEDHGRMVAFGIVMQRGGDAFLSFLFVEPRWQERGLGRAVFSACLRGAANVERISTCAEADQPVSTGLYAAMGLVPRTPVYLVRGALPDDALPELPDGIRARPIQAERVEGLDQQLVGYTRPQDHAFWSSAERQGWMYLTADDQLIGYGYAHTSGRVGPVATVEPGYLPSLVGHVVRSTHVLEGRQVVVPGPSAVLGPLLRAGMRIDGTPAVYCAQGAGPWFDRYVPMSYALL